MCVVEIWQFNVYSRMGEAPWSLLLIATTVVFEAKAMIFCPRAVLEVEDSPRGPLPCITIKYSMHNN